MFILSNLNTFFSFQIKVFCLFIKLRLVFVKMKVDVI